MSSRDRAVVEAELKALRKVRNDAIAMDRNPENDPYLWGYGGYRICQMLTRAVQQVREELEGLDS